MASICQHFPLLAAWAHALARLELWWCHAQEHEECGDPAAIADAWCASPGAALRLRLSLAVAALLLAAAAAALFWRLVRVGLGSQSERAVAAAIAALKEMRKAEAAAAEGPPARHMFTRLPADDVPVDPLNPLLCSVCGCGIGPGAGGLPAALQCCAACGLVVHDGCARRAGKTCRPLCCAGPRLPHFWQAKGTVLEEPEDAAGAAQQHCLYCREVAETDGLVAAEPLWRCALCAATCHVQCWAAAHPQAPGVAAKLRLLMQGSGGGGGGRDGEQQRQRQQRRAGQAHVSSDGWSSSPSSSGSDGGGGREPRSPAAAASADLAAATADGNTVRRRRGSAGVGGSAAAPPAGLQVPAGAANGCGSSGGGTGDPTPEGSGYSSDTESDTTDSAYDAHLERLHHQRRRRRQLLSRDIAQLDACTLGANRRSVLPPTAVRPARKDGGGTQAEPAAGGKEPASEQQQQQQQQQPEQQQQPPSPFQTAREVGRGGGGSLGSGGSSGGGSGKKSWWHQLSRPKGLQWQDYRIEELPPGVKPVLVFLNTKSGPQVGTALRRRFLRALHPLQVVELPRQKPGPALRLFARVAAHARILVVGGDGSVAWVLSCLEELKEQRAAAGDAHWVPPPVGVLPLGTGNDLARCLGWGGGHGAWAQEGVGAMLAEVQHGAPVHIDRWNVSFLPRPPLDDAPVTPRGKLASMLQRGHSLAMDWGAHVHAHGGGGGGAAGPAPEVKQLNNYLGIGVDAKVALEFHHFRDKHPYFFTSQLGNKFWYTSIGGVDIVQGHACANLARKLQVLCDGRPVALPPDIEGLLVLNINSYMGGVDLWRNGYSLPPPPGAARHGGGGHAHAPQSMLDGRVELVGVFGSWHLGQLQVGLSRAVRLGQGREVTITTATSLPMQVDGEPWVQPPTLLRVTRRGQGLVLRRVQSKPLARILEALSEVLEESEQRGTITPLQHRSLKTELSARLQPLLLHSG